MQTVESQNEVSAPTSEIETVFEAREPLLEVGNEFEFELEWKLKRKFEWNL